MLVVSFRVSKRFLSNFNANQYHLGYLLGVKIKDLTREDPGGALLNKYKTLRLF